MAGLCSSTRPHRASRVRHPTCTIKRTRDFFVLEGTLRFEVDGEATDVPAGGYARVPPGVVHRWSNPGDQPCRFLGLAIPGGLDRYLEELGQLMANEPSWPPADMGPAVALMAKYDTFPPPAP
jgi:hypothetical protein